MGGTLASRFAAARHKRGWSQAELAERAGLDDVYLISAIERGTSTRPRCLGLFAPALGVSEAWLMFGTHVLTPPLTPQGKEVAQAFERMTASDRAVFRSFFQAQRRAAIRVKN